MIKLSVSQFFTIPEVIIIHTKKVLLTNQIKGFSVDIKQPTPYTSFHKKGLLIKKSNQISGKAMRETFIS